MGIELYTSYYNNRKIPKDWIKISVSLYPPSYIEVDEHLLLLAPNRSTLSKFKQDKNEKEYIVSYYKNINLSLIKEELRKVIKKYGKKKYVLLCYENPNEFCHRHLISGLARGIKEYGYTGYNSVEGRLVDKCDSIIDDQ